MADTVYCFARCEVRLGTREVFVDGRPIALEPRPFNLLVYLIEHANRVVSKDELLAALWENEFVSPSAIAQAVKKVRQVIGDDAAQPTLIRTVHRTGYRFVGELAPRTPAVPASTPRAGPAKGKAADAGAMPAMPAAAAAAAGTQSLVSVALLPFENRTGQPALDWIELGLMSLVAKALAADRRIDMPAIPLVLTALATLPEQAGLQERGHIARRLLGVSRVVHTTVGSDGNGFWLEFGCGESASDACMRLTGRELTELGQQMARGLQAALFPVDRGMEVSFDSQDLLANQALARSLQAIGREKWREALHLLDVVLDIEPGNPGILLQKLRVLVAMEDDKVFELGAELLAQVQSSDARLTADVHLALGDAYMRHRLIAESRKHLEAAMRAAGDRENPEWLTAVGLLRASVALSSDDLVATRVLLDQLEPACDREDSNQLHRVRFLMLRGALDGVSGNLAQALPVTHRLVDLQRSLGMRPGLGRSLANLALMTALTGHLKEAAGHGEEAVALNLATHAHSSAAQSAVLLCRVYHLLRRAPDIRRVASVFDQMRADGVPVNGSLQSLCEALHASALGAHAHAAQLWREAGDRMMRAGQKIDRRWTIDYLLDALILSGQTDAVAEVFANERAQNVSDADPHVLGSKLYWNALLKFLAGDRVLAQRHMQEAASVIPDGLWRANACINAGWLHLESGDVETARTQLRRIEPWLADYPAGLVAHARLFHAEGAYESALQAHQRYVEAVGPVPACFRELGEIYARAARQSPRSVPALPAVPLLPTMA